MSLRPRAIVLTGGPGSGKTRLARELAMRWPGRIAAGVEAATQVYAMLGTRWDRLDDAGRRDVQRRIYQLQLEQEERLRQAHPGQTILLDRGTVDGSTYWPDGAEDYWRQMGTTRRKELARYDAVIWLGSAAELGAYDGDASNPFRHEDAEEAVRRGQILLEAWRGHPGLVIVNAREGFEEKREEVERVILQGEPE